MGAKILKKAESTKLSDRKTPLEKEAAGGARKR